MMFQSGFLGTNASFITDFTLLAEITLFIALCIGVIAQRRGQYKLHDWIQTPVVILNLFLIVSVMITSFMGQRVISTLPQRPGDAYYLVVALHAGLGLIAEGLAFYCLLAGHQILPRKIGRLRYWMWATFVFWTAALIAGVATYIIWYVQTPEAATAVSTQSDTALTQDNSADPTTSEAFLQNFAFTPADLTVTAGTEVVWLNQDGAPHNITFVDGSVASDNFFQGESFATTFSEPGSYLIYCTLHGSPDGSGMSTTVTVLADNAENAAIAAAAPTPNPVPPTATPAPTVPPPPVDLLEPAAPEQTVVGLVSFFDIVVPSDSVAVLLNGIPAPTAGATYEAWLTDSQTNTTFSLGQVMPDGNGRITLQFTDANGRNLLGLYDGFQLTTEPQFDDDPSPGTAVFSGQQLPQALSHIRAITVVSGDAPAAYGLGARLQAEELLRHAEFVQTAYDLLSIADAQRHAEHIVNLLSGAQGDYFGDLDGVHGVQNPGDGFGILPYVAAVQATAVTAANAPDATNAIQIHSTHVVLATDNALAWATQIQEAALQILAADSVGDIGTYVDTITQLSPLMLNGADNNGDGEIAPAEGGIFTAYQHTQYMAAIPVVGEP
ncbi:plastocyanin/azurin family copper-binding protein [Candidatus Leptofilum sp.]|uniref:plastocyanin/azurin family copper-binding protein n=1 Tax=Candidatus Leptofilum sp. TaxID=3241576 RepID=UPI003B5AF7DA